MNDVLQITQHDRRGRMEIRHDLGELDVGIANRQPRNNFRQCQLGAGSCEGTIPVGVRESGESRSQKDKFTYAIQLGEN